MSLTTLVVDGGAWSVLWQRLAQALHVYNTAGVTSAALRDVDDEPAAADVGTPSPMATAVQPPDWSLLSFKGLSTALSIAVAVFIKVSVLSWCTSLAVSRRHSIMHTPTRLMALYPGLPG